METKAKKQAKKDEKKKRRANAEQRPEPNVPQAPENDFPKEESKGGLIGHLQHIRCHSPPSSEALLQKYAFEHVDYSFIEIGMRLCKQQVFHQDLCQQVLQNVKKCV